MFAIAVDSQVCQKERRRRTNTKNNKGLCNNYQEGGPKMSFTKGKIR